MEENTLLNPLIDPLEEYNNSFKVSFSINDIDNVVAKNDESSALNPESTTRQVNESSTVTTPTIQSSEATPDEAEPVSVKPIEVVVTIKNSNEVSNPINPIKETAPTKQEVYFITNTSSEIPVNSITNTEKTSIELAKEILTLNSSLFEEKKLLDVIERERETNNFLEQIEKTNTTNQEFEKTLESEIFNSSEVNSLNTQLTEKQKLEARVSALNSALNYINETSVSKYSNMLSETENPNADSLAIESNFIPISNEPVENIQMNKKSGSLEITKSLPTLPTEIREETKQESMKDSSQKVESSTPIEVKEVQSETTPDPVKSSPSEPSQSTQEDKQIQILDLGILENRLARIELLLSGTLDVKIID